MKPKLEVGKRYRSRGGGIALINQCVKGSINTYSGPLTLKHSERTVNGCWFEDGTQDRNINHQTDLVSEYAPRQHKLKFKRKLGI